MDLDLLAAPSGFAHPLCVIAVRRFAPALAPLCKDRVDAMGIVASARLGGAGENFVTSFLSSTEVRKSE